MISFRSVKSLLKFIFNKDSFPLFIVFIFGVLAARSLIFQSGYFNMHDDLQMMRQLQMEKCFLDGQIPCRWVPDMGYGFGFPLFNFYPPLPYLIGEIFRLIGFSFVNTVKLTFALSIIASGYAMYFLAKKFFGTLGGVLSAIFYIWAPYHAVDVYVRGAMNEAWALVFFPLIFLFSYQLITSHKSQITKNVVLLAFSYSALFTSHNLMVLIFTPFFGIWVFLHLWREGGWSRLPQLVISGIWAFGLAAFFTLPALIENQFTQVKSQLVGYYDYTAHFVSLRQLFISRFWGYGPSVWVEAEDRMSFQIGHVHWILALVIGVLLLVRGIRKIREIGVIREFKTDRLLLVSGFMLLVGWFSAYMTHLKSIWIYQAIPQLGYIQFSWRFLTLVIFAFSFIAGVIPGILSDWKSKRGFLVKLFATPPQILISLLLIILLVILNWNYFRPEYGKMGTLTDEQKFSGAAWELQQTAGIYDYLPLLAKTAPKEPQKTLAEVMGGKGTISGMKQGTHWVKFDANIDSDETLVRIGTLHFPGWRVFLKDDSNIKEVGIFIPNEEEWGRMWIKLPKGKHLVYIQFYNTPIRTLANIVSIISFALVLIYPAFKNRVQFKS